MNFQTHTHREREKERKDQRKTHDKNYRNTTCQRTKNKQTTTTLLLRASKQTCTEGGRGGKWAKPTVVKAREFSLKNLGFCFFFSAGWCE
jgi:hypothetical protein